MNSDIGEDRNFFVSMSSPHGPSTAGRWQGPGRGEKCINVNKPKCDSTPAINEKDNFPCRICHDHCNTGIRCSDCLMWIHYKCSEVTTYVLVNLIKSNRKFTCLDCTKKNYPNYDELAAEIEKYKLEECDTRETTGTQQKLKENGIPQAITPVQTISRTTKCTNQPWLHKAASMGDLDKYSYSDKVKYIKPTPTSTISPSQKQKDSNKHRHGSRANTTARTNNATRSESAVPSPSDPVESSHKKICRYYRKGGCKYGIKGEGCSYSHPKSCPKLFRHGLDKKLGFTMGSKCTYFHPTICRNSIRSLKCFNENCRFPHIKGTIRKRDSVGANLQAAQNVYEDAAGTGTKTHQSTVPKNGGGMGVTATQKDPQAEQASFLEIFMKRFLEMEKRLQTSTDFLAHRLERLESRDRGYSRVPVYHH